MTYLARIKSFWDEQAKQADTEMGNTLGDENLRRLEVKEIGRYLQSNISVLDIGCGNGYSTIQFAKDYDLTIRGMDYSDEMIRNAQALLAQQKHLLKGRVSFVVADALEPTSFEGSYDAVATERCLINLCTWENQQAALRHIHGCLRPGGRLLMLEGFRDNLQMLNQIRERFELDPIKVIWHNRFFEKDEFERFVEDYFDIETVNNFGSTYMLITRCYLHAMQKDDGKFDEHLDRLATLLPNFGDYNYQRLYVLRKR